MLIYSLGVQEYDFEANPYSRVHQEKLSRFRDEVFCIQKVLYDQLERMKDLKNICWSAKRIKSRRSFADEEELAILGDCISSTDERIASFEGMATRAINLGTYVSLLSLPKSPRPSYPSHTDKSNDAHDQPSERLTHRSKQRPPRSRPPILHSRNNYIPPLILRILIPWHEYIRCT